MTVKLSAVLCVHNEEKRLAACLERLRFADELVIVLDRCTDGSRAIAQPTTPRASRTTPTLVTDGRPKRL